MLARIPHSLDQLRRSFWLLPAVGMIAGLGLGFGLVELDYALDVNPGVFTFVDLQSARAVLETIATVTVSVAGLSFSVTVVALQLASQQLSPRVLRTFQGDRLAQGVLAAFVGTFVYALIVLAKLTDDGVPAISVTVAISAAVGAFGLFVAFIHNIVVSLKASTLIKRIALDGRKSIEPRWPSGAGDAPDDLGAAQSAVADQLDRPEVAVLATDAGFVTTIDGGTLVSLAARRDVLIFQRAPIGAFAVTRSVLATVHGARADDEELQAAVREAFSLADERSVVGDVSYPIRQLVDIALRALSPSLNDPTTAENALDAITDLLVRVAVAETPEAIRIDADGAPRLVAVVPTFEDLVHLGFEQVRIAAVGKPAFARHLVARLDELAELADELGLDSVAPAAEARLMRQASGAGDHMSSNSARDAPSAA